MMKRKSLLAVKWGNRMTNQEILAFAIKKVGRRAIRKTLYNGKYSFCIYDCHMKEIILGLVPFEPLIFSHDFAKAFWGEEIIEAEEGYFCLRCDKMNQPDVISWKYYLQQMVLEENPLKYLEKFL